MIKLSHQTGTEHREMIMSAHEEKMLKLLVIQSEMAVSQAKGLTLITRKICDGNKEAEEVLGELVTEVEKSEEKLNQLKFEIRREISNPSTLATGQRFS